MKQMKLFLVTLMVVVMGMSVSSCLNGDDNNGPTQQLVVGRLDSYGTSFKGMDGTTWIPNDPTSLMLLNSGMYTFYAEYNLDEIDATTGSISFTLLADPTNIDGERITTTPATANAPMFALNYNGTYYPMMFDANTLLIPVMYYCKNVSDQTEATAELNKHRFVISYDQDEVDAAGGTLNLYLNHIITEDEEESRTATNMEYKAYDLSPVLYSSLSKILVHAEVNASSNDLDNANDAVYEINYSLISQ